eukprot:6371348-Pyramimonas_sp.AAC.1
MVEQRCLGNYTAPLRRMLAEQKYSSAVAASVGGIYLPQGGHVAGGQLHTHFIISSRLQYPRQRYHASFQGGRSRRKVTETQYGFRPGRGTSETLFLARRLVDAALDDKYGKLLILLLDWRKAFDRIKTDGLLFALRHFGVPSAMLDMIAAIYRVRRFVVKEGPLVSSRRVQEAGIAQGCPLSPYLFIIVMSVFLEAVDDKRATDCDNFAGK